jgi:hypothetical protein
MARKSKAKFELKGHTLPGINQKSETANIKDGRSPSSAFQQKSSPNKILGAVAGASMLAKGVGNLVGGNKKEDGPKELLEGTGKTVEKVTGFKVSGGGDATGTTTPETTMPEPGGGTAATEEPDEVLQMRLKTGKKKQ